MKTKEGIEMIIGKRYWLDSCKDVSGILVSVKEGDILFKNPKGRNTYNIDDEGCIKFSKLYHFYPVD